MENWDCEERQLDGERVLLEKRHSQRRACKRLLERLALEDSAKAEMASVYFVRDERKTTGRFRSLSMYVLKLQDSTEEGIITQ